MRFKKLLVSRRPRPPLQSSCRLIGPLISVGFCQGRFARVLLMGGDACPFQRAQTAARFLQLSLQTLLEQRAALDPRGPLIKQSPSLLTIKNAFNPSPPAILIYFFKHGRTQFSKIGVVHPPAYTCLVSSLSFVSY